MISCGICLTSRVRISRFVHVAADGITVSFLWLSGVPLYTCVHCVCVYTHTRIHMGLPGSEFTRFSSPSLDIYSGQEMMVGCTRVMGRKEVD